MDNKTKQPEKIKRKKFFLLFGASVAGVIGFIKSPIKIFSGKGNNSNLPEKKSSIKIEQNPLSVKRESKSGIFNS